MIEVYVALALITLGYILNENKEVSTKDTKSIGKDSIPSQTSLHESNHYDDVKREEEKLANAYYKASQKYKNDNNLNKIPPVISKNYHEERKNKVKSKLAGVDFDEQEFVHSNMVPFYKGKINPKEIDDPTLSKTKIENFTGVSDLYRPKRETKAFFEPKKDMSNVNGAPNKTDYFKARIPVPVSHNNVLPFKQVKVGPGLDAGFSAKPQTPEEQQMKIEEVMRPKTTDQLRTANNPKVTYPGRLISGQKGSVPGKIGKVFKNKPDRVYHNTPDKYLRTTGAYFKPTLHPKYNAKQTNRQNTEQQYYGPAYNKRKQQVLEGKYTSDGKQQLNAFSFGPANAVEKGNQNKYDYGKNSIQIFSNERDTTTAKTYQGNLTSLIKAAISPVQDAMKFSRKEYLVDNPRQYANMNAQMPKKQPVKDPNDVTKTTIKETTLNETPAVNLKGHNKQTVYDPNNVARTTIKETTLNENEPINLKGPVRCYVYDPNDVTKTTIKETTLNEAPRINLTGPLKCYVHDPNDNARTTIKETTLSETQTMNLKGNQKCYVYDPNDIARTTIKETTLSEATNANIKGKLAGVLYIPDNKSRMTLRETLDQIDNSLNIKGPDKGYVYDPNDTAKTTIKETTLDGDYVGNVDSFVKNVGEYRDNNYELKDTHKQYLSDHEYMGQISLNNEDGYQVAPTDIKDTFRQYQSDDVYLPPIKDKNSSGMSYDDMLNANITDSKEVLLKNREPTKEGVKIASGVDKSVDLGCRKKNIEQLQQEKHPFGYQKKPTNYETLDPNSITKAPNKYEIDDDRIDLTSIEILKKNPFFKSII